MIFKDYLKTIEQLNTLGNGSPVQWFFHPGMLFSTLDKWWGDFKYRASVHEGIDITYFKSGDTELQQFDTQTKVPAFATGKVLNICQDFLGQTLVVEYQNDPISKQRVVFVYAHVIPVSSIARNDMVQGGEMIATISDTRKNPLLPPHLHFSCLEVPRNLPPDQLNWDLFSKQENIQLYNPFFL